MLFHRTIFQIETSHKPTPINNKKATLVRLLNGMINSEYKIDTQE